jgi:hypothetical protein
MAEDSSPVVLESGAATATETAGAGEADVEMRAVSSTTMQRPLLDDVSVSTGSNAAFRGLRSGLNLSFVTVDAEDDLGGSQER